MTGNIKVALAGAGAFGIKHLDGIKNIDGVEVVSLVGRRIGPTKEIAARYAIRHVTTDLADSLALSELDAVIFARLPRCMRHNRWRASRLGSMCRSRSHSQIPGPMRKRSSTCRNRPD